MGFNPLTRLPAVSQNRMPANTIIILLAPFFILAIAVGCWLLRRATSNRNLIPEEFALAAAWIFFVGALAWLSVYLSDSTLLGFGAPWTWLAAAHFGFAGFGGLTITALVCRVVSNAPALRILRFLLAAHPIAYLVTAAGISGYRYCDELGASAYTLIFLSQFAAVVFGRPDRMPTGPIALLILALAVPTLTMIPAMTWAWGHPMLDITHMVKYHGLVNAIGHVGLGLVAFGWGRPASHAKHFDSSSSGRE